MATTIIPTREYAAGERILSFPPSVLKRFVGAKIVLTRENWPPDQVGPLVIVIWEMSEDGVVWVEVASTTFPGGNLLDMNDVPVTISAAEFRFSSANNVMISAGVDTSIPSGGVPAVRAGDLRLRLINSATLNTSAILETIEP